MLSRLIKARWPLPVLGGVLIVAVVGWAAVGRSATNERSLVVYNGRSHYGDEQVFKDFEKATGVKVVLRGGIGPRAVRAPAA